MCDMKKPGKIKKVHFIGIGGIGMSAIARYFVHQGISVSGSDWEEKDILKMLQDVGVDVVTRQVAENITDDIDAVVYTNAMPADHPELATAHEKGIATYSYPEILGMISEGKTTIAIAGTHGKTTTTAMVGQIFMHAGLDPTMLVGSLINQPEGPTNFVVGDSEYFIVEADEYKRSFLNLSPQIVVITNLEADHLDYYTDLADVQSAFRELVMKVPADGVIVCPAQHPNVVPVIEGVRAQVVDYMSIADRGIALPIPGEHNRANARAATVVGEVEGVDVDTIREALETFTGTWRRFEYLGDTDQGAHVYDDYAHHPTEVRATLSAFREKYSEERLVVVFQPHLYSRTRMFLKDFGKSFTEADKVIVAPIYAARESDPGDITNTDLAYEIQGRGVSALAASSLDDVKLLLGDDAGAEVIVVMGAGNIRDVGEDIVADEKSAKV